jgi:hypothetical protein
VLALLLLAAHNKWEGTKLIVGETPEMVAQLATPDLRARGAALLVLCTLGLVIGLVIGLLVLFGNWVYSRLQSA